MTSQKQTRTIQESSPRRASRPFAAFVTWLLVLGQVMQPVFAATTPLADVPIAAKVSAKPNIVYTLDDSGSMKLNYLPDYLTSSSGVIAVSELKRPSAASTTVTARGTLANFAPLSVGDQVSISGAAEPEYNGYFTITSKTNGTPTATQAIFTYELTPPLPTATLVNSPGLQVVVSAAYCRGGSSPTPCVEQSFNMNAVNTIGISRIQRAAGSTVATATTTAAALLPLSIGDFVTVTMPASPAVLAEFAGLVQITGKPTATTFTYTVVLGSTVVDLTTGGMTFATTAGSFAAPPMHAAEFNALAYNPRVTYLPPLGANGLPLTKLGITDANGNYGTTGALYSAATVDRDPFASYEVTAGETPMWATTVRDNLSLKVQVPVYCNTDWPTLLNDPFFPGGPNGIKVQDVGDANGQSSSGTGGWCRINGNAYTDSAASGARAIDANYNYPWSNSTIAANNFRLAVGIKTLYCDLSSPYRPRNPLVITGCRTGLPNTTAGPVTKQTCSKLGAVCNTNPLLRNYSPASCKTDPANLYCTPGVGGSNTGTPGLGTGGLPECMACNCVQDMARDEGRCSSDTSTVCYAPYGAPAGANSACLDKPSVVITGCADGPAAVIYQALTPTCTGSGNQGFLWDPVTNTQSTVTPLADANGAGLLCRRNNLAYAVTDTPAAGGLATYPRTKLFDATAANRASPWLQTGAFTTAVTSGCPVVGTTVAIPRHYYQIESVQFCDSQIVATNDQWQGFGTPLCKDNNDLQRFKHVKYGRFTRVDLFAGNPIPFPANDKGAPRTWLAASPTPENSESVNYANWYAYYSTRLNAAKTTSSIAFSYLTTPPDEPINYRVGFHNLGDESPPNGTDSTGASIKFVNVKDWDPAQRTDWYNALFGIAVATQKTPTMNAMLRIGNLFENGGASGVDSSVTPLPASAIDPITVSCQNNYHILFTDGKTNQYGLPTAAAEQDATISAGLTVLGASGTSADQVMPNFATAGAPWPRPFVQGTPPVSNTLSDIAAYYWTRDLRPGLKNDVPSQSGAAGGDLDPAKDVAWWQHVNFNAISFGAEGLLNASTQIPTIADLTSGALAWPNLTQPNDPLYPKGAAKGAVAVDDLWHAAMMSRGSFVYAKTPIEVAYGLANILSGIQNQRKSRSGAAFNGQVLDATNNVLFVPTIEPGWAGDLVKTEINPYTGAEVNRWWNAAATLRDQIDPAIALVPEPWMNERHRRIVTLNGLTKVAFRRDALSTAQQLSLAPTQLQQEKLVAYLRGGNTFTLNAGQPSEEVIPIEGIGIGQFRKRFGALGDISNAQPVVVGPPERNYIDRGYYDRVTNTGYAVTWKDRLSRIVAPANDGMVHVFDAGPMPPSISAGGGKELFAFIPKALFRGTAGALATEDVTALQALAYQDGGIPIYHHHMYVDSSPRAADVDFSGGAGTDWRTIVVGGLGKGGNSYYALDLTHPGDPETETETSAKERILWEWSDPEVKYSFGRPVIVKVRETGYPYGRWVVIVTGGYNNVSGEGKVFFLDAATGIPLRSTPISTGVGTPGNPSGLAQIHAFVKNQNNQIAEQIYGGDLEGNVWRIDVSGTDQYKSASARAVLFAQLIDPLTGLGQPITTAPQIEIDINNGIDRYVFVGTGRLLDNKDLTSPSPPQAQAMYAIRDGTLHDMQTTDLPRTRADLKPINGDGVSAITGGAPNGWYDDLPNVVGNYQRIVVDPDSNVNIVQYIGTRVQDDPCLISLPANLYARDYTTARSLLKDPLDPLGKRIVSSVYLPSGAVGAITVARIQADGSLSLGVLISGEIPNTTPFDLQNPVTGPGSRLSWRLLGVE